MKVLKILRCSGLILFSGKILVFSGKLQSFRTGPGGTVIIIIIIIIIIVHVYTGDLPATTVDVMGGPVVIKY